MDQVKEIVRLVAYSNTTPLSLFSRTRVGRAGSMVCRWRESVVRGRSELGSEGSQSSSVNKETIMLNGRAHSDGARSVNNADTSKSKGTKNDIGAVQGVPVPGQSEAAQELFRMKNAFEAQRPRSDVMSKPGMSLYMKKARATPRRGWTASPESPSTTAESFQDPLKSDNVAGPAGRWGPSSSAFHETSSYSEPGASSAQGAHAESFVIAVTDSSRSENDLSNQGPNGALLEIGGNDQVLDDDSDDSGSGDDSSSVEGDMCASTTGVVRLQSRRKAEMYLVRTDGISCTRERVKESTLAFTHPSTQQQMLMWKTSPKTVLLLKKLGDELMEEAQEVAAFLYHEERMNVMVEPDVHDRFARFPGFGFVQTFYNQDSGELHEMVDFVVCLGGDGVILHASNLFPTAVPPVVSFNLGSLGFLTTHPFHNFKQDLQAIIHGNSGMKGVYITLRMRLRCELVRNGKLVPGKVFDVLNEIVVDRGSNPYLCKIECYERNRLITKVQADGVLVATPTGSTAYSTSAGGSMVHPNVPCMLFTPICPHSLSFRPVILPDSALLELKVPNDARNNAWVSFDGKRRQQLCKGDSVRIAMSQHPLPTVDKSDQTDDWFSSLVRCLNWNERLEQKALI